MDLDALDDLYDRDYFVGKIKSNYDNYSWCEEVICDLGSMIEQYVPKFDSLFDAGCAYGHLIRYFKNKISKVSGCDCSRWALNFCKEAYLASIDSLPEEDNSFDLVTCFEVMEHIPEEYVDKVLSELYRVSREYVIMTLAYEGYRDPQAGSDSDSTHCTMKPGDWWIEKLSRYEIDYDLMFVLSNDPRSSRMGWSGRFIVIRKE